MAEVLAMSSIPETIPDFILSQAALKTAHVVKCGCGKRYTADEFEDLRYCGIQHISGDQDNDPYDLELRNCPCGSTISLNLGGCECRPSKYATCTCHRGGSRQSCYVHADDRHDEDER